MPVTAMHPGGRAHAPTILLLGTMRHDRAAASLQIDTSDRPILGYFRILWHVSEGVEGKDRWLPQLSIRRFLLLGDQ